MGAIKRTAADKWFSDAVRLRANSQCEHCGLYGRTECAHIVGRREKTLRWCADNALSLCHTCHRRFTENPCDFVQWLLKHVGEAMLEILAEKRLGILKDNKSLRDEVAAHYRAEYRRMESTGCRKLESFN
jgi:hypothetical protein